MTLNSLLGFGTQGTDRPNNGLRLKECIRPGQTRMGMTTLADLSILIVLP
jgi:hypothetical protein